MRRDFDTRLQKTSSDEDCDIDKIMALYRRCPPVTSSSAMDYLDLHTSVRPPMNPRFLLCLALFVVAVSLVHAKHTKEQKTSSSNDHSKKHHVEHHTGSHDHEAPTHHSKKTTTILDHHHSGNHQPEKHQDGVDKHHTTTTKHHHASSTQNHHIKKHVAVNHHHNSNHEPEKHQDGVDKHHTTTAKHHHGSEKQHAVAHHDSSDLMVESTKHHGHHSDEREKYKLRLTQTRHQTKLHLKAHKKGVTYAKPPPEPEACIDFLPCIQYRYYHCRSHEWIRNNCPKLCLYCEHQPFPEPVYGRFKPVSSEYPAWCRDHQQCVAYPTEACEHDEWMRLNCLRKCDSCYEHKKVKAGLVFLGHPFNITPKQKEEEKKLNELLHFEPDKKKLKEMKKANKQNRFNKVADDGGVAKKPVSVKPVSVKPISVKPVAEDKPVVPSQPRPAVTRPAWSEAQHVTRPGSSELAKQELDAVQNSPPTKQFKADVVKEVQIKLKSGKFAQANTDKVYVKHHVVKPNRKHEVTSAAQKHKVATPKNKEEEKVRDKKVPEKKIADDEKPEKNTHEVRVSDKKVPEKKIADDEKPKKNTHKDGAEVTTKVTKEKIDADEKTRKISHKVKADDKSSHKKISPKNTGGDKKAVKNTKKGAKRSEKGEILKATEVI